VADEVEEVMGQVNVAVQDVMDEAVVDIARELQKDLSVPVGRDASGRVVVRSKPGEYPRMEKNRLRASVSYRSWRTKNAVHGEISTDVFYDKFLVAIRRDFPAYTESKWTRRLDQRFEISLR
jgi:hypothetical protein